MNKKYENTKFRGKAVRVPVVEIDGRTVVVTGKWLKTAAIKDEELVEGELIADPQSFILKLHLSDLGADVFTFSEALGVQTPRLQFPFEWDNAAVIRTSDFAAWWTELPQAARKNARRAEKLGLEIRAAVLDDDFARGIKHIYDESPVRQGRPFWHYQKDLQTVILENGTYPDRSEFIGAYHKGQLVGFMKWVYVGTVARILQILSLNSHQDMRPMNALIAKAVEICEGKGVTYLVYSKYTYGKRSDTTLAEFKRRNGFKQLNYPRYFVPLTLKGRLALKLGVHHGLVALLPPRLLSMLAAFRAAWFSTTRKGRTSQT